MSLKKPIDVSMTDTEQIRFKRPIRAEYSETAEGTFLVQNHSLGLNAHGETLKDASIMFKDMFIVLANDLHYKSRYAALTGKERERLAIIEAACDFT